MAALLAAKAVVFKQHFFQHVTIADLRRFKVDAVCFAALYKAEVRHDGADDAVLIQLTAALHIETAYCHDEVAVDDFAVFVGFRPGVVIIFAFGADLTGVEDYSGDKFEYLKNQGYNYYSNVDSSKFYVQLRDRYFRMGRRNLDG